EFRDLLPVLPEIVLAVGAMALLMVGAFRGGRNVPLVSWFSILLLLVVGALLVWLPAGKHIAFAGSFVLDDFGRFLKLLALAGSAIAILMSFDYLKTEKQEKFE